MFIRCPFSFPLMSHFCTVDYDAAGRGMDMVCMIHHMMIYKCDGNIVVCNMINDELLYSFRDDTLQLHIVELGVLGGFWRSHCRSYIHTDSTVVDFRFLCSGSSNCHGRKRPRPSSMDSIHLCESNQEIHI
jgi:hypothetical protein